MVTYRELMSKEIKKLWRQKRKGHQIVVHHKDGNHNNDDPSNLQAMTQQQHVETHVGKLDTSYSIKPNGRRDNASHSKSPFKRPEEYRRVP